MQFANLQTKSATYLLHFKLYLTLCQISKHRLNVERKFHNVLPKLITFNRFTSEGLILRVVVSENLIAPNLDRRLSLIIDF